MAVFHPIRELARLGHHVHAIVTQAAPPGGADALREWCDLDIFPINVENSPWKALKSFPTPLPMTVYKYLSPKVFEALDSVLKRKTFDVVHFEFIHMAGYAEWMKKRYGLPAVLREQNIESQLHGRFAETTRPPLRWYLKDQARRLERYEAKMAPLFDMCMTITENDRQTLLRMAPSARTVVLPAGIDPETCRPLPVQKRPGKLVFLGAMSWPPNVDSVRWFSKDILPGIRERIPETVFYIVGSNPSPQVKTLHDGKNIVVTGYVKDVREHVCDASAFVVPLRVGGGMRLKIIEAMAMGAPIVSTSIGCEGIEAEHGRHILIADTAGDFRDTVAGLLRNPALAGSLSENAGRLVNDKYSWESVTRNIMVPAYLEAIVISKRRVAEF